MNCKDLRRGMSVLQVIGAMLIASLLMMTGSRLLQLAYRAQRESVGQLRQLEALAQLSDRMKLDVTRATNCTITDQLELSDGKQLVRYEMASDAVVRRWGPLGDLPAERGAGDVLPGEQSWPVPSGTTIAWELDQSQQQPLLRCTVAMGGQRDDIQWTTLFTGDVDEE
ncbi:MAG: hypothetical protein Aurels2KO_41170 [Aureliella sp.]